MRSRRALVVFGLTALLLTPGAVGVPDAPSDSSPPLITPLIFGTLGNDDGKTATDGWFVSKVIVNWKVEDPESPILSWSGCEPQILDTDTPGKSLTCSATSEGGGPVSVTKTFTIDKTAPAATASPSRPADANGWYNHELSVGFTAVDTTSGFEWCSAAQVYGGPDTAGTSMSGTCRDKAGNTAAASLPLKYDETAPRVTSQSPSRSPDANGWYNRELTVTFGGSDLTSGLNGCDSPSYSPPDSATASVSGRCRDKAGNESASSTFQFAYDATAPLLVPALSRAADANGWHNHAVTVGFPGTDATSGIAACTPDRTYNSPDSSAAPVSGSCTDLAGNRTDRTVTLKYDATPPALTPAFRPPDANGWHNHSLEVSFPGTDAMSQIDVCTPKQTYEGPDALSATVSGTCRDLAGNATTRTAALSYDDTPPALTPAPSRPANANGWYRQSLTVGFPGTDATSGIDTCTPDQTYGGPDDANASVRGFCRDKAGNRIDRTFALKYDATTPQLTPVPSRPADANGWYNHELTIRFPGTDATSGVNACTPDQIYDGPDSGNVSASVLGSCTDKAGNTINSPFGFKYDSTAPQVTGASPARPPEPSGWYTRPVVFGFQGTDSTPGAGIDTCPEVTYDGPDGAGASVTGACLDKAGNVGKRLFPLRYDDTGPAVTAAAARGPDVNGWYNHPLTVSFAGSDTASGVESCVPAQGYDGPDSVFAVVTGTCLDKAGNVGLGSLALKYDSTAPQVSGASPDRVPDGNGWYSHPLTVNFYGSDATSHVDACTAAGYAGPDNPGASIAGSCRDRAGNQSGASAFAFRYDGTAPSVTNLRIKAGNRSATLSWDASPDTSVVEIVRRSGKRGAGLTVYRGTGETFTDTRLENGVRYRYTLTGYDEARNAATREVVARPTAPLLSPQAGTTVSAPPRLVWKAAEKATYYNVQVWRRGRIFSAWPTGTSLQLRRTWTYNGRRYRLTSGRYRWYVWPGYGRRAEKKFGRLLGSSSFVVR